MLNSLSCSFIYIYPFLLRELTLKHWSLKQSKRGSHELILPSSRASVLFLVPGALVLAGFQEYILPSSWASVLFLVPGALVLAGFQEYILPSSWASVLFLVPGALVLAGLYCLCSTSCRPTVCTRNSNIFSPLKYVYKYTIQKDNSILLWIHFYSLNINLHGFQTHHEIKWTTKSK